MLVTIFNIAALFLYLAAGLYQFLQIHRQNPITQTQFMNIVALGVSLHATGLFQLIALPQGFDLSIFNMFSLVMAVINALVYLSCIRKPLHNLYIFLLPLAVIAITLSIWLKQPLLINVDRGVTIHILLSILAYSILTITALQALLMGWQNHQLKSRQLKGWVRLLPPLQTMETLMFELLWTGVSLLSVAIVVGFFYIENIFEQQLTHKTVLSLFALCVFAGLLWGRHNLGWRGYLAIKWVLTGFSFLLLAYFGSKLALEIIL